MKVKVTDKNHPLYNQEFDGYRFYFDYLHTGDSPDIFIIKTDKGEMKILSTQIDEESYEKQEIEEAIKTIGGNVGDTVMIVESGSGSFKANFSYDVPHVITKITPSGHVEFDNGEATIFRPKVKVLKNI